MRKKNSYAQASDAVGVSAKPAAHTAADPPAHSPAKLASFARHAVWLAVILALAASLVTLANDFACDDVQQIINNGLVKNLANAPAAFTTSAWQFAPAEVSAISQSYYRPLFNVWLMVNSAFFGSS